MGVTFTINIITDKTPNNKENRFKKSPKAC